MGAELLRGMAGLLILPLLLRLDLEENLGKCVSRMTQLIDGILKLVVAVLSVSAGSVSHVWAMMVAAWIAIS